MKHLLLITACLGFIATAAFAQQPVSTTTTKATTNSSSEVTFKYFCPKCMKSSDKPGTCTHCHVKLVREGEFYCPKCGTSSTKPGKCHTCKGVMKQMTADATPSSEKK